MSNFEPIPVENEEENKELTQSSSAPASMVSLKEEDLLKKVALEQQVNTSQSLDIQLPDKNSQNFNNFHERGEMKDVEEENIEEDLLSLIHVIENSEETEGENEEENVLEIHERSKAFFPLIEPLPPSKRINNDIVFEKNSGFAPLFLDRAEVQNIMDSMTKFDEATIAITQFSPHKTDTQYVCPRTEVEKFTKKTKLIKRKRLWEINFIDQMVNNLKRNDFTLRSSTPFCDITWVEMNHEENVVMVSFKRTGVQRMFKLKTKLQMWKLYELCMLAVQDKPCWIPQLLSLSSQKQQEQQESYPFFNKKISLTGSIHYQVKRNKNMVIEKKTLTGNNTHFSTGSQYEKFSVYCVTWNLQNSEMPLSRALKVENLEKICRCHESPVGMYAFCLQHLNPKKNPEFCKEYLEAYFGKKYVLLNYTSSGPNNELLLFVFVAKRYCRRVTRMGGNNKGKKTSNSAGGGRYVMAKVQINESPISLIGVQIPRDTTTVAQKSKFYAELFADHSIMSSHHHVFLMGDFGYSLTLNPSMAVTYIKKNRNLLPYDGFYNHRVRSRVLEGFKEGEITYPPIEPIREGQQNSVWGYDQRGSHDEHPLGYTGRILIWSYPGEYMSDDVKILDYGAKHEITCNISPSAPVYSVFVVNTQRTHISHFSPPTKKRIVKFEGLYIGRNLSTAVVKVPHQLTFEADWLETSPVVTQKPPFTDQDHNNSSHKCNNNNPTFHEIYCPQLVPVKWSDEFLSSQYLKISLQSGGGGLGGGGIKAVGVLSMRVALENKKNWFSIPMYSHAKIVCQLMGIVKMGDPGNGGVWNEW